MHEFGSLAASFACSANTCWLRKCMYVMYVKMRRRFMSSVSTRLLSLNDVPFRIHVLLFFVNTIQGRSGTGLT